MHLEHPISSKTLKDFWADIEAPNGYVFFLDQQPFLQVHFFKTCYTIFVHGSIDNGAAHHFLGNLLYLFDDIERVSQKIDNFLVEVSISTNNGHKFLFKEDLNFKKSPSSVDRIMHPYYHHTPPYGISPLYLIERYAFEYQLPATSININMTLKFKQDKNEKTKSPNILEVAYWLDTDVSKKIDKDYGLTTSSSILQLIEPLTYNRILDSFLVDVINKMRPEIDKSKVRDNLILYILELIKNEGYV